MDIKTRDAMMSTMRAPATTLAHHRKRDRRLAATRRESAGTFASGKRTIGTVKKTQHRLSPRRALPPRSRRAVEASPAMSIVLRPARSSATSPLPRMNSII
jgi:hypothetical protein